MRGAFSKPLCVKGEWAHQATDGLSIAKHNRHHLLFTLHVTPLTSFSTFPMTQRLLIITGLDYCNGPLEWTAGLTAFALICPLTIPIDLHPVLYKCFNKNCQPSLSPLAFHLFGFWGDVARQQCIFAIVMQTEVSSVFCNACIWVSLETVGHKAGMLDCWVRLTAQLPLEDRCMLTAGRYHSQVCFTMGDDGCKWSYQLTDWNCVTTNVIFDS